MNYINRISIKFIFVLFLSFPCYGDSWPSWTPDTATVPFFFASENMGNTLGIAGVIKGVIQPQASLLGVALYSDKNSYMTYGSIANYSLGERWLFGLELYNAKFVDSNYYLGEQGNNASTGDVTIATGYETKYRMSFRYILPWGEGSDLKSQAGYKPYREIKGSDPFSSGVTSFEIQPFYASRDLDLAYQEAPETWGTKLKLDWDNRNDMRNPTEGSKSQLELIYSPEYKEDSSWATIVLQNNHYWDIGPLTDLLNKQVIAFSFYTANTLNWSGCTDSSCHRPPEYEGVKLGGLFRLRSFNSGRYHGRSAVHYSAEYRVMPEWQPLGTWPIFSLYNIPWWQWVAFTDIGRVTDEYKLKTLHEDMKWSAGGAIRFQVEGIVVRTEIAWGNEESVFRIMANQPF